MNQPSNPFTSSRNATELIDRYLHAVRFWLPKTRRQEDLLAELGEDLRSQVEDKEAELGRTADQNEVAEILKRCGNPMAVAANLGPKRSLIGPGIFPIYAFVLKMVLLWIMVPVFLFIIGPIYVAQSKGDWGSAIASTMGNLWFALFVAASVITLVFALIERTNVHAGVCKWDPLKLPPLPKQERKTSFVQPVCELAFGWFWMIWLLLIPHYPVLILGPAATFLQAAPLTHILYLPVVLLGAIGLARAGMILARPDWTSFPVWSQLLQTVLTLIVLNFMLYAAGQMPGGEWHPFVVPSSAYQDSVQWIRVTAIVNASILISMIGAWVGLSIAGVIQLWKFLRHVRDRARQAHHAAAAML